MEQNILEHDFWRSHFNTPALTHQFCNADLQRDLNYFTQRYQNPWSMACKSIFLSSPTVIDKLQVISLNELLANMITLIFLLMHPTGTRNSIPTFR